MQHGRKSASKKFDGLWKKSRSLCRTRQPGRLACAALSPDGAINDAGRLRYVRKHLAIIQRAIQSGTPVEGYYLWSLLDNFEWRQAYQRRFGIVYVDFKTQKTHLKQSALWSRQVIANNSLDAA